MTSVEWYCRPFCGAKGYIVAWYLTLEGSAEPVRVEQPVAIGISGQILRVIVPAEIQRVVADCMINGSQYLLGFKRMSEAEVPVQMRSD